MNYKAIAMFALSLLLFAVTLTEAEESKKSCISMTYKIVTENPLLINSL